MAKDLNRRINIYINGKEVRNTLAGVGKEIGKVNGQLRNTTRGTEKFKQKSRELKELRGIYSRMNKEIGNTNKQLKQGNKNLGLFTAAFAGGFAISSAISSASTFLKGFVSDSVRLAGEAKGVNFAFNQISGSVELLERARQASKGLVSDLDIKKAANTFTNFRLNLEPLPELLEFVTVRAAQTGESFDGLLNSLVEGLSKESVLRIDNLGISQKALNDELERTPDFIQAVANIASQELSKAGNIIDSAGSSSQRFNVAMENLQLRFGSFLDRSGVASFFTDIGTDMLKAITPAKGLAEQYDEQLNRVIALEEKIPSLLEEYEKLSGKTNLSIDEQSRLNDIIKQIAKDIPGAVDEFDEYGKAISINTELAEEYIEAQKAILNYKNKDLIEAKNEEINKIKQQISFQKKLKEEGKEVINKEGEIVYRLKAKSDPGLAGVANKSYFDYNKEEVDTSYKNLIAVKSNLNKDLEKLTGDFLDTEKEARATQKTEDLKLAKERAEILKIPYKENIDLKDLQKLIEKEEFHLEKTKDQREKNAIAEKKRREKEAEDQKKYREEILLSSQTLLEQEDYLYVQRLKKAGIYNKDILDLTEDEKKIKEKLEQDHQNKLTEIELKEFDTRLNQLKRNFESEKAETSLAQTEEINSLKTLEQVKAQLLKYYSKEEVDKIKNTEDGKKRLKQVANTKALEKEAEYLQQILDLYQNALDNDVVEGINFGDNVFTEQQKEELLGRITQIKTALAGVKEAIEENKKGDDKKDQGTTDGSLDFLGTSVDNWQETFANLDNTKEKVNAVAVSVKALGQAWQLYANIANANDERTLQSFIENTNAKKLALQQQLDEGVISNEAYQSQIVALNEQLEIREREIALKKAKRDKVSAIFDIAVNTASAIAQALPNIPLSVAIGAIGAAQGIAVATQPLPKFNKGGFTYGLGFKDETGEQVAGVVHKDEYVINKEVLYSNDSRIPQMVDYLENKRLGNTKENVLSQNSLDPKVVLLLTEIKEELKNASKENIVEVTIGDNKIIEMNDRAKKIKNIREQAKVI